MMQSEQTEISVHPEKAKFYQLIVTVHVQPNIPTPNLLKKTLLLRDHMHHCCVLRHIVL